MGSDFNTDLTKLQQAQHKLLELGWVALADQIGIAVIELGDLRSAVEPEHHRSETQ